jgi:hypothetical protein
MEIALVVLSIVCLSFMIAYSAIFKKLKVVNEAFAKTVISYNALLSSSEINNNISQISNDLDIHKENFIKFLSDSRDWAFDYIEEVQNGLQDFIKNVEPSVIYFEKYGLVTEGSPHYQDMKLVSDNFKKLKQLLPEEINDRR